ncbi:MAG: pyridoxal 5'-phosphate synthase glutaminase subunit PdxT, partial [Actinomycetota bacterium]
MIVGVLALQGDVREHINSLSDCGVSAIEVKSLAELERVDALVIPGGESTTISKLSRSFGLIEALRARIKAGMPTYGSCAGLILISERVL